MKIKKVVNRKKKPNYFGETEFLSKKTICRVFPKTHRSTSRTKGDSIVNTIIHEKYHADHPNALERTTYKKANQKERGMILKKRLQVLKSWGLDQKKWKEQAKNRVGCRK